MTATIIDGKIIAAEVRAEAQVEVKKIALKVKDVAVDLRHKANDVVHSK